MGNLTYEAVYDKIFEYYESKLPEISRSSHQLHIITGVFGPKVYSTLQLGSKKDLLVLFTERTLVSIETLSQIITHTIVYFPARLKFQTPKIIASWSRICHKN